jgi:hypothetical protein
VVTSSSVSSTFMVLELRVVEYYRMHRMVCDSSRLANMARSGLGCKVAAGGSEVPHNRSSRVGSMPNLEVVRKQACSVSVKCSIVGSGRFAVLPLLKHQFIS